MKNDNNPRLLSEYKNYLIRRGRSKGTIDQRVGDHQRLARHVGLLSEMKADQLENHLDTCSKDWSPAYRKKVYISYRHFFKWAKGKGRIPQNPAKKLDAVRVPPYFPRPAPDSVVLDAFEEATLIESAMLCLGATQGLRRIEIATAHPRNRDGANLLVVGKNGKARVVPLDPLTLSLLEQIEAEQGTGEHHFRGRFGGHVHPTTVYKWLKRHLGEDWSTHNLRHRAGSNGNRVTRNLRGVQELLGHASLATTQIYTSVDTTELIDIVAANSLQTAIIERRLGQVLIDGVPLDKPEVLRALQVLKAHLIQDAAEKSAKVA